MPRERARYLGTGSQKEDRRREDEQDDDEDATKGTRGVPCPVPCPRCPLPGPLPTDHNDKKEAKEDEEA